MSPRFVRVFLGFGICLIGFIALLVPAFSIQASGGALGLPGYVTRYGVFTSSGELPNGINQTPRLSANGQLVAFFSNATNLGTPNPNGRQWMYVYDRVNHRTELVSISENGVPPNEDVLGGAISPEGRYIVFHTTATNLLMNQTDIPGTTDIFLYDRLLETIRLISHIPGNPNTTANGSSKVTAYPFSGDERWIVFSSESTNLVPGDTNNRSDVFVYDTLSSSFTRILDNGGIEFSVGANEARFSQDGQFVVFIASSGEWGDIYVADLQSGTGERVDIATDGTPGNNGSTDPSISADGRFVVFESYANNLDPRDVNNIFDIFLHDRQTHETTLLSIGAGPHQLQRASSTPEFSSDGRYVLFYSQATNLIPGTTVEGHQYYLKDLQTNEFFLVSIGLDGLPSGGSGARNDHLHLSADGTVIGYSSSNGEAIYLYTPPEIHFGHTEYNIGEGDGEATVTVTLESIWDQVATVNYTTSNGSATTPGDYTMVSGTITIPVGQTEANFTVPIIDDTTDETAETILLALEATSGEILVGRPYTATLTLEDNDGPAIVLETEETFVLEDSVTLEFTASLETSSVETITVGFTTEAGSATPGSDYVAVSGTLTFPPGITQRTFMGPLLEDTLDETDEVFTVRLEAPEHATLGTPAAIQMTMDDDDGPAIVLVPLEMPVQEGGTEALVQVDLSAPSPQRVTVDYETVAGTATAGGDYLPTSGTLNFEPGQTSQDINIPILDDIVLLEDLETFSVTLSSPTEGDIGTPASTVVTLQDNDIVGESVSTTVIAPSDPDIPVTISLDTEIGTVALTLTEVISDGTITITARADTLPHSANPYLTLPSYVTFETDGVHFAQAAIVLPYRVSEVTALGVPEASLRLLSLSGSEWHDVTTPLTSNGTRISGAGESLNAFVIGYLPIPECAVTINNGTTHTGIRTVHLFTDMEQASEMLVSNDAGFPGASWQPYTTNLQWTLTNPGPQISTLLSYIRVRDASGTMLCGGLTLSDDILYDPLPPEVYIQSQRKTGGGFTFTLLASDQQNGSGVADMQISLRSDFVGSMWQPFSPTAKVEASAGETVYVRVRDGVGNRSTIVTIVVPSTSSHKNLYLPLVFQQHHSGG